MKRWHNTILLLLVMCVTVSMSTMTGKLSAAARVGESAFSQEDLDGDGDPDVANILEPFVTERDKITVVDGSDDMPWGKDWRNTASFTSDIWIFDIGGDGTAQLIIQFGRDKGSAFANLYDDQNGDGIVAYQQSAAAIKITEGKNWSVRVVSNDGDWIVDGRVSVNLTIYTDGLVYASWEAERYLGRLLNDGRLDVVIKVRDRNGDGLADYEWRDVRVEAPEDFGILRTNITMNTKGSVLHSENAHFWPYLGDGAKYPYSDHVPIQVDWKNGKIDRVAEFVQSRSEQGFYIYSIKRLLPGQLNNFGNFEYPFAFYDLAEDSDGVAELIVRHVYFSPNSNYVVKGAEDELNQWVRYSWDQDNDNRGGVDYKLSLFGHNTVTESLALPDFTGYESLDPMSMPEKLIKQYKWDGMTFVSTIDADKPYISNEGIYEWDRELAVNRYLLGKESKLEDNIFSTLPDGFQGEYALNPGLIPELYFSQVDNRLHLKGAVKGLIVNKYHTTQMLDLSGDGYFDAWMTNSNRPDGGSSAVYITSNLALLVSSEGVSIKRRFGVDAKFVVQPPTNSAEWRNLGKMLKPYQDLQILRADEIFSLIQGESQIIPGAKLSQLRFVEDGYRFVLDISANSVVSGFDPVHQISELPLGKYLVSYSRTDDRFEYQKLTPPKLVAISTSLQPDNPTVGGPTNLNITVENTGLQDSWQSMIIIEGETDRGLVEIIREPITVLSGKVSHVSIQWTPEVSGNTKVTVRLINEGEKIDDQIALNVHVNSQIARMGDVLSFSTLRGVTIPAASLLIVVFGLIVLALTRALQRN